MSDEKQETFKNILLDSLKEYPEFLVSRHLVQLGLYPSLDAVYLARARGDSPNFLQMKRKILYPKKSIVDFLIEKSHKGK